MDYNVNENTLVVIPSGEKRCKVIENKNSYNISKSSFKVIEHSCEYFGVSYKSRIEGSQKFIKTKYKNPIIIEESSRIVFFPISATTKNSLWISYSNIFDFYPCHNKKGCTTIRFKNGYKMEVPVSFYSFNNQYLKASRLTAILVDRTIKKN